jgi:hypothetical protein
MDRRKHPQTGPLLPAENLSSAQNPTNHGLCGTPELDRPGVEAFVDQLVVNDHLLRQATRLVFEIEIALAAVLAANMSEDELTRLERDLLSYSPTKRLTSVLFGALCAT